MLTEQNYSMMRRAFSGSVHEVIYEPPPLLRNRRVDAEFLSLGFAEQFGSYPPPQHGIAYLIRNDSRRLTTARFIVTGVTLPGPTGAAEEIAVIIRSIVDCVNKHNQLDEDRINTIGISEDHFRLDEISADLIRNIVMRELS
jgi:hypothetical protein